jgi:putative ABC transport system permease protein
VKALTKKVFKDVTHRKLRTTLTILGIAIGIIGLSAISIASNQFKTSFEYSTDITAQPDIQYYTAPTSPQLADTLQHQPNIKTVQALGFVMTRWSIPSIHIPMTILGILDFRNIQINRFELVEGSLPGPNQILLESSDRALNSQHVGDQIDIQVRGVYQKLTISGFVRTRGFPSASLEQSAQAYMNESDIERLFQLHGVNSFMVRLNNYELRNETAKQLSQIFNAQHVMIFGANVGRNEDVPKIADGLFATMNVLSVIAIVLSICLLLGTITALITEQVQYIGTMKAIGAARGQVIRHYLTLATVYGAIGTCIGLILGIPGGYLLARFLGGLVSLDIGPLQVPYWLILECIVIGIGTPLLAAALPAYFGTRVTVKQALSGYGVESGAAQGGRAWAKVVRRAFGGFPQTAQFGIRGLFRKRTRTILTLITLTISGAAFLAVQTTSYSFDTLLNHVFSTYHFDVMVAIPNAQPFSKFQQVLSAVPGVTKIEKLSQDKVPTQWGDVQLTGVQLDTQLYLKQILAGRWFTSDDQNVVIISKDTADKSGLKVGDTIAINTSYNSANWHIIGIASDYSGVGPGNLGVLLAPITQVDAFKHLPPDYTDTVMIQSADSAPTAVDALATRIDDTMSAAGLLPYVTTNEQQIERDHSKYQIIYVLLDVVAIIVALVGAIGLSNTLAMSVLERRREIGILRSMGATSSKVAQVFWTEGTSLGVLSWILAMVLGFPTAYGFVLLQGHLLAPVPFSFNPLSLIWMLGFIILIASLSSIGPVMGATRVKIVQTLRYE